MDTIVGAKLRRGDTSFGDADAPLIGLGPFNGVPLDSSGKPMDWGCPLCDKNCRIPFCEL
jgi:hypothetical protein